MMKLDRILIGFVLAIISLSASARETYRIQINYDNLEASTRFKFNEAADRYEAAESTRRYDLEVIAPQKLQALSTRKRGVKENDTIGLETPGHHFAKLESNGDHGCYFSEDLVTRTVEKNEQMEMTWAFSVPCFFLEGSAGEYNSGKNVSIQILPQGQEQLKKAIQKGVEDALKEIRDNIYLTLKTTNFSVGEMKIDRFTISPQDQEITVSMREMKITTKNMSMSVHLDIIDNGKKK